jgi:transcriptional regulator with XRE-family HTH domain
MPEKLGARLRQRREQQQIALSTIAEQTKIKASLLDELEHDDVSHWPAGIFRRAFVRAYAHAIGLDPDVVVREFLERYPDPIEVVATPEPIPLHDDRASVSAGPPMRLRYLIDATLSRLGFGPDQKSSSARETLPAAAPASQVFGLSEPDLLAAANLCTRFGRLEGIGDGTPLLEEAARILDAIGLVVWVWHSETNELNPVLAHGYSERVLAQLPPVRRDADNATAAAFRSAQVCVVPGSDVRSGALVVPLNAPAGCVGVLATELRSGREQRESVRALVTIFAAQLARAIGVDQPAATSRRRLA